MKKSTTQKLLKYGALTAVLGGASEVNGQIIYTDVDPDVGGAGVLYSIDMDNDGNDDFQIRHWDQSASGGDMDLLVAGPAVNSNSSFSNSIIASSNPYFVYPMVLNAGDAISAGATGWNNESFQSLDEDDCYVGNWCNVTDKYLGLRFKIGTDTHYGWARLSVGANASDWVIKDYAYNGTPGEAIDAGETDNLSLADNFESSVQIVALDKSIGLYNLPSKTSYNIYEMTGKRVLNGEIGEESYVIEANGLNTGIYIVELKDDLTGELKREKVIL